VNTASRPSRCFDNMLVNNSGECQGVNVKSSNAVKLVVLTCLMSGALPGLRSAAQLNTGANTTPAAQRDGSHDFDFLIGNWKAHVRVLPDRLNGSHEWVEYDGISNHKKLLDSSANLEEFDVYSPQAHRRIKAQTLRLYNPDTHQWSIYLVDLDKGVLSMPPEIGQFTGNRGEFYDQEPYKGRAIYVRYVWLNISPKSARLEQSFSDDGGSTWEVNWICELSR
jgi:hypothetical protein